MKAKSNNSLFHRKSIVRIAFVVGLLLLIPLVLTIRDGGVEGVGWNWKPGDFIAMGALLFTTGLAIDFVVRRVANSVYRFLAIIAIIMMLLLIWVELAVDGVSKAIEMFF